MSSNESLLHYTLGVITPFVGYAAYHLLLSLCDATLFAIGLTMATHRASHRMGDTTAVWEYPYAFTCFFLGRIANGPHCDRVTFANGDQWRLYFNYRENRS